MLQQDLELLAAHAHVVQAARGLQPAGLHSGASYARRGTGVGRQLLRSLVERGSGSDIYLTTLGSTMGFYEREGFREVSSDAIPRCVTSSYQAP